MIGTTKTSESKGPTILHSALTVRMAWKRRSEEGCNKSVPYFLSKLQHNNNDRIKKKKMSNNYRVDGQEQCIDTQ